VTPNYRRAEDVALGGPRKEREGLSEQLHLGRKGKQYQRKGGDESRPSNIAGIRTIDKKAHDEYCDKRRSPEGKADGINRTIAGVDDRVGDGKGKTPRYQTNKRKRGRR